MRLLLVSAALAFSATAVPAQNFVNYESPQVHPIEVSADGTRLFVVNTPDQRVAVYSLAKPRQPVLLREVFVGLEPVSVRARTEREIWVVNYLSDSISVVSLQTGQVLATIRVKDEPTDVVFAQGKAFVAVSGSDEVRVFDAVTRQALGSIAIFGDEPRYLTSSTDGKTVWTVVHRSGNETTILPASKAPPQPKPTNPLLPKAPQASLIIDSEDPAWSTSHDVVLPDFDLVEIDVATAKIRRSYSGVGTSNFAAALRPGTDEVWVGNTQARNLVRFETKLRGHALDNRVTRVNTGAAGSVTPFDLNPSIDYSVLPNNSALSSALAQPVDVCWNRAGTKLYVAAFGTDRIGMVDAAGKVTGFLEIGDTAGTKVDPRHKRGPRGLALHPSAGLLYVINRLSNSLSAIDTATDKLLWELGLPDPTPVAIKQGRGFLYDAKLSGNGTFSCAGCHVDGDLDGLAWDLGDPGGKMFSARSALGRTLQLHPMKGPMLTQTLKGLKGTGPMHWRGDKPKLTDFNGAFDKLMGKTELVTADMDAFVTFMEEIAYGSNPNRSVEGQLLTQDAKDGENLFHNVSFAANVRCVTCHTLPTGTNGLLSSASILQAHQAMKTAQLRNIYKRFGFRKTPAGRKNGFGLIHDGESQDLIDFLSKPVFGSFSTDAASKRKLAAFVTAWDTGTPRAVGFQVSVNAANLSAKLGGVTILRQQAEAGVIDLIIKGQLGGAPHGLLYKTRRKIFETDSASLPWPTWADLEKQVRTGGAELTLTGVPRLSGRRLAIDRDLDGILDGDEGVSIYGLGSKGCAGTPTLNASSDPRIGNVWFSLVGSHAQARALGILGIAAAKAKLSLLGVDLLIDVSSPATLYLQVFADAQGELALALPLPDNSALVGLSVFNQVLWVDNCGSQDLSATQGLGLKLGK